MYWDAIGSLSIREECFIIFFQAEDGIRDIIVTGVQTCALPISVFHHGKKGWTAPFNPDRYRGGVKLAADLVDAKTGKVRAEAGSKLAPRGARKLYDDGLKEIQVTKEELAGRFLAIDIVNEGTGEVLAEAGDEITEALLIQLEESKAKELPVL